MLLVSLCLLYFTKSIPNTFQSMFELLENDEIRNTTCEYIKSAVDNGPYFQIYDDTPRTAIFVIMNFDHVEIKIRYKNGIESSQRFDYDGLIWISNSNDTLRTKMISFVSDILKKKLQDGNVDIAIDVFSSERYFAIDYKRHNEEISFINDVEKALNVQNLLKIRNLDFVVKRTIIGDQDNKMIIPTKKTQTVVLLPSVSEILDDIVYKDNEFRKLRNEYLDCNYKNRICHIDQYGNDLILYMINKIGNDLTELENFFNIILYSDIKFDFESQGFFYHLLKSLFTSELFVTKVKLYSGISFNLRKIDASKFNQIEFPGHIPSLIKFITGDISNDTNFNELEDFCQEVLKVLYRNLKYNFLLEIQKLITEDEINSNIKDHFFAFIMKIKLILEQKVNLYKNICNALFANRSLKKDDKTWKLKGLRSIHQQKNLNDYVYIKKHLPKLKSKKMHVYSKVLYDLIRINNF